MKNILACLVIGLFITQISFAQSPVHFGIKTGANFTSLENTSTNFKYDAAVGYLGGLFVRFDLPKKWIIQPEAYYSVKRNEFNVPGLSFTQEKADVDAVLLLGYRVVDNALFNFRAMAGPYNSFNVGSSLPSFATEEFEKSTLGYQAGLGVDIAFFTLDVRYEGSFSEIQKDLKYSNIQVALGFKFI